VNGGEGGRGPHKRKVGGVTEKEGSKGGSQLGACREKGYSNHRVKEGGAEGDSSRK